MAIRIVFLDCDGTLTREKSSWEHLHRRLNLWDNHADAYQRLFREGKIGYHEFCRRDALLWAGRPVREVMGVIQTIPYRRGARQFVSGLHGAGVVTAIISTGLSLLVEKVRADLGVVLAFANDLLSKDGVLTGEIRINVDYNKKGLLVRKLLEDFGFSKEEACAVGDGEGDRDMFEAVGLAIGVGAPGHLSPILHHNVPDSALDAVLSLILGAGGGG